MGLNLCPFAKRELVNDRIRFSVSDVESEEQLLFALDAELDLLDRCPEVETTLLIHPLALSQFEAYNHFLGYCDELLLTLGFDGVYQIASFHPHYCFQGCEPDDAQNYTNRSPYPMLHLIREESLERAILQCAGNTFLSVAICNRRNLHILPDGTGDRPDKR